jgi:hypothetical protein
MRDLSAAFAAALEGEIIYPLYFYEIVGSTGTLRLWSGFGDREWNGYTWSGVGWLIGMSEVEEATETRATSITLGFTANAEVVSIALQELKRNKPCTIWMGLLSEGFALGDPSGPVAPGEPDLDIGLGVEAGELIDVQQVFSGRFDMAELDVDSGAPQIRLKYSSAVADLERPRVRRQTPADQAIDYPDDKFFNFTGALSDAVINWGVPGATPTNPAEGILRGFFH